MSGKRKKIICTLDYPIVETKSGKLRGYEADGVFTFKGVKYAVANRFSMPVPVASWDGIKDALSYGYVCPLMDPENPRMDFEGAHRYWPKNEDCLSLNIWTDSLNKDAKKPVMFWIHGGGYSSGSSIEMLCYEGDPMARENGVVVVSVNHRINCLGYLDLSAYGEEFSNSGVLGMSDIIEALRWVKNNISSFGGDPGNVTIFGESGGGSKVLTLMQMPAADGLYHKAICESGVLPFETVTDKSRLFTSKVVKNLGLSKETINEIRTIPYQVLADACRSALDEMSKAGMRYEWCPVPCGEYYPGSYNQEGFRKETSGIPVIIGCNICELSFFLTPYRDHDLSPEEEMKLLRENFGEGTNEVVSEYRRVYPEKALFWALGFDARMRSGNIEYCKKRSAFSQGKTYNYIFDYEFPYKSGLLAWHSTEMPFVFRTAPYDTISCTAGEDMEPMMEAINGAWIAFARTGSPNCLVIPEWPEYSNDNPATMLLGTNSHVRTGHDFNLIESLNKYGKPFFFRITKEGFNISRG